MMHLHVHSEHSRLDGMIRIPELIKFAQQQRLPAVAVTDHAELGGLIDLALAAKEAGIKPIFGCEFYFVDEAANRENREAYHLTVWAQNQTGLNNLYRLASASYAEGFYYRPRIDQSMLARWGEGLIAGTACLAGRVPKHLLAGEEKAAEEHLDRLQDLFPAGLYLELMTNSLPDQVQVNHALVRMGERKGLPLVLTSDSHYVHREDFATHELLLAIQTKTTLQDPKRLTFEVPDFYLLMEEQARESVSYIPLEKVDEAIANTYRIAEQCQAYPVLGKAQFPQVSATPDRDLQELCQRGLEQKIPPSERPRYEQRLQQELQVLQATGFANYILLVHDYVEWARQQNILMGPGRGSVAGSLVAYLLGITSVDPIRYQLWFERFINPDRKKLPDIDLDFRASRRDEVVDYLRSKYGADHVAHISTVSRLKPKAVVNDVARALGLPEEATNRVRRGVSWVLSANNGDGREISLREALAPEDIRTELAPLLQEYSELFGHAERLEGLVRHAGKHAAGIVIGDRPLVEIMPLRSREGMVSTQYEQRGLEALGCLKVDLLGLKALDAVAETLELIETHQGIRLTLEEIPVDDTTVWADIGRGDGTGLFQLETEGLSKLGQRLRPSSIEELAHVIALYRPGPLRAGIVQAYIDRKRGGQEITYLHPRLEPILSSTCGCILFQEQVLQVFVELAGYTPGQADGLRQVLAHGDPEEWTAEEHRFTQGCLAQDIPEETARVILDQMRDFGVYSFNKAHAVAYGLLTYYTAYMRQHFPTETFVSLLNTNPDRETVYQQAARERGVTFLPPAINASEVGYSWAGEKTIRAGLLTKFVSEKSAAEIHRKAPYESFADFYQRVDRRVVNKRVVEALHGKGVFDGWGDRDAIWPEYLSLRGEKRPGGGGS